MSRRGSLFGDGGASSRKNSKARKNSVVNPLQAKLAAAKSRAHVLEQRLAAERANRETLEQRVLRLETQLAALADVKQMRTENQRLSAQVDQLQATVARYEREIKRQTKGGLLRPHAQRRRQWRKSLGKPERTKSVAATEDAATSALATAEAAAASATSGGGNMNRMVAGLKHQLEIRDQKIRAILLAKDELADELRAADLDARRLELRLKVVEPDADFVRSYRLLLRHAASLLYVRRWKMKRRLGEMHDAFGNVFSLMQEYRAALGTNEGVTGGKAIEVDLWMNRDELLRRVLSKQRMQLTKRRGRHQMLEAIRSINELEAEHQLSQAMNMNDAEASRTVRQFSIFNLVAHLADVAPIMSEFVVDAGQRERRWRDTCASFFKRNNVLAYHIKRLQHDNDQYREHLRGVLKRMFDLEEERVRERHNVRSHVQVCLGVSHTAAEGALSAVQLTNSYPKAEQFVHRSFDEYVDDITSGFNLSHPEDDDFPFSGRTLDDHVPTATGDEDNAQTLLRSRQAGIVSGQDTTRQKPQRTGKKVRVGPRVRLTTRPIRPDSTKTHPSGDGRMRNQTQTASSRQSLAANRRIKELERTVAHLRKRLSTTRRTLTKTHSVAQQLQAKSEMETSNRVQQIVEHRASVLQAKEEHRAYKRGLMTATSLVQVEERGQEDANGFFGPLPPHHDEAVGIVSREMPFWERASLHARQRAYDRETVRRADALGVHAFSDQDADLMQKRAHVPDYVLSHATGFAPALAGLRLPEIDEPVQLRKKGGTYDNP